MEVLTTKVARILFALPFLLFGLGHLVDGPTMSGMIYHIAGTPALILNYMAGAGLILASIAILMNKNGRLACLLLAVELFLFIVVLHIPKMMGIGPVEMFCDNPEMMAQVGFVHMLKDLGLMAGALTYARILSE